MIRRSEAARFNCFCHAAVPICSTIPIMGTDCCGGPAAACQEKTRDFGEASSAKLENHDPSRSWEEIYASKKSYYDHRVATFESIKAKYDDALEAAKNAAQPITLTMPDGSTREGVKGVTTPMDIALGISKGLAKKSVVARVDGGVWDMMRPLEGSCKLELVTFDDPDGKDTFWHSSAHLLGQALELEFGADLTIGPALEEGFYYDCFLGNRWVFVDSTEMCGAGLRPCARARSLTPSLTLSLAHSRAHSLALRARSSVQYQVAQRRGQGEARGPHEDVHQGEACL